MAVRRACGFEGIAVAGPVPVPPVASAVSVAPDDAPQQFAADEHRPQRLIADMFVTRVRRTWEPPTKEVSTLAMAAAAAEAGWSFTSYALPSVRRLFYLVSGKNISEGEVSSVYSVRGALAPLSERLMSEHVVQQAKLAQDHTLSVSIDGWQNRRGSCLFVVLMRSVFSLKKMVFPGGVA